MKGKIKNIYFKIELEINEHNNSNGESKVISTIIKGHESNLQTQRQTMQILHEVIFGKLIMKGDFMGIEFALPEDAVPGVTGNFSIGLAMVVEREDGSIEEYFLPSLFDNDPDRLFDPDELKEAEELFEKYVKQNSSS